MTPWAWRQVRLVIWALAGAVAYSEGWAIAWVVVGIGLGLYWSRVTVTARAEIRRRDGRLERREWRRP